MASLPRIGIAPVSAADAPAGAPLLVRRGYLEALREAGALPVVLAGTSPSQADDYLDLVDGLLLPGGADLPLELYGAEPEPSCTFIAADLAGFQVAAARRALARDLPTLGICLGCQTLNVALGGSLWTDLAKHRPGTLDHGGAGGEDRCHPVDVETGSRLRSWVGEGRFEVPCSHHQAVRELAPGLRAVAFAADGVIEAVEHAAAGFFVGVQWHPERGRSVEANRCLIVAFVAAAAAHAARRR